MHIRRLCLTGRLILFVGLNMLKGILPRLDAKRILLKARGCVSSAPELVSVPAAQGAHCFSWLFFE